MAGEAYVKAADLDAKARDWLEGIKPHRRWAQGIKPESSVLIVVDMQNYFLNPGSHAYLPAGEAIVPRVNQAIALARSADMSIVFTAHAQEKCPRL